MIMRAEKNSDRLEREIRNAILSGAIKTGERLSRVKDLAQAYQITYGQAQRAIKRLEKDGLIITRRGDGTFVRYRPFINIEQKNHQRPGAFLLGDRFFWSSLHERLGIDDVIRGIERIAAEAGLGLHQAIAEEAEMCFSDPATIHLPIVVLTALPPALQMRLREEAQRGRTVIIIFGSPKEGEWALSCDADGATGMRMAMQHLTDLGHRRIAFVSWKNDEGAWWIDERETTYRVWMQERAHEVNVFQLPPQSQKQKADEMIYTDDRLVSEIFTAGLTAVLCVNDLAAQRIHAACRRQRINIPEDRDCSP